ncbi:MAG: hypothetical protein D6771_06710 [Zetaproteobacteria bacterium]|nr:MAG: hypothetical protein D6771_06710 [Zetaproteobacteria bacterium]
MRALIAVAFALAAVPAWAYRQQAVVCLEHGHAVARDAAHAPQSCTPFDPNALHARAAKGDAKALDALLAVAEQTRLLPPLRVSAAQALAWPKGRPLPEALKARAIRLFASTRAPFKMLANVAAFLQRFSDLHAPDPALLPGLARRLIRAETCPLAAQLLAEHGETGRRAMLDAWFTAQRSDLVTQCVERAIGRNVLSIADILVQRAKASDNAVLRMRAVNWLALAGPEAKAAIAAFADDPDARVRRLVEGYLAKEGGR